MIMTYLMIAALLLIIELTYFKIAEKCNITDKPNDRSSHTTVVLRGGGIIFFLGTWVWSLFFGFQYPWFLAGLTLVSVVSFVDDVNPMRPRVRLLAQMASVGLSLLELGLFPGFCNNDLGITAIIFSLSVLLVALIICVGALNIVNFMDGINGITAVYALAVLIPLLLMNTSLHFVESSLLYVTGISVLVFSCFNFRPKGKAKCFSGDVGSIGIAFILLFLMGKIILDTSDITWLILMLVYAVDGCLTMAHRIMLHEHLGHPHRKHAYQLMCNELKIGHVKVSLLYMGIQLLISLGFIYLCPNTMIAHGCYLMASFFILAVAYLLFMKKYYHLHEAYLASLKKE